MHLCGGDQYDTVFVARPPTGVRPQVSACGRSLFTGAMANVVMVRHGEEQVAQYTTRVPDRQAYRS
jgi:hypothetical protein